MSIMHQILPKILAPGVSARGRTMKLLGQNFRLRESYWELNDTWRLFKLTEIDLRKELELNISVLAEIDHGYGAIGPIELYDVGNKYRKLLLGGQSIHKSGNYNFSAKINLSEDLMVPSFPIVLKIINQLATTNYPNAFIKLGIESFSIGAVDTQIESRAAVARFVAGITYKVHASLRFSSNNARSTARDAFNVAMTGRNVTDDSRNDQEGGGIRLWVYDAEGSAIDIQFAYSQLTGITTALADSRCYWHICYHGDLVQHCVISNDKVW